MIHGTSKERSLDPPDMDVCPEDCEHLVDGECQGSPPEDCPDYGEDDMMDALYEGARDNALEDKQ